MWSPPTSSSRGAAASGTWTCFARPRPKPKSGTARSESGTLGLSVRLTFLTTRLEIRPGCPLPGGRNFRPDPDVLQIRKLYSADAARYSCNSENARDGNRGRLAAVRLSRLESDRHGDGRPDRPAHDAAVVLLHSGNGLAEETGPRD